MEKEIVKLVLNVGEAKFYGGQYTVTGKWSSWNFLWEAGRTIERVGLGSKSKRWIT